VVDVSALSDQVRCPARRGGWARVLLAGLLICAATGWPTPAYAVAAGQLSIIAAPRQAPAAPTGLSATPGNASATVTFTAPSDGGSAVTGYEYSTDGTTWHPLTTTTSGSTETGTITDLINGTTYPVAVRAVNSVGTGAPSAAASVTPAATAPAAPTGLSATPGNASATVTFTAPSDGGSAVTGYEYSTDGTTWHPLTTTTSGSTETGTITDLINGTTYQVAVRAVNSVGTGAPSAAASVTPAATAPAAPTGLSATPGNASATVTFTAPSDGGSAVTGYEYSTDGTTWHPLTTTTSGSTETGTITDLINGTTYQV